MRHKSAALMGSALALLAPVFAFAQTAFSKPIVPTDCLGEGGCKSICDIATLAQNVLNTGIYVAVFLSAILFAYAGFKYLTAGASGEGTGEARKIFSGVIIGLIIILVGWLVVDTLMKTLTGEGKFGTWNKICEILSTFERYYA